MFFIARIRIRIGGQTSEVRGRRACRNFRRLIRLRQNLSFVISPLSRAIAHRGMPWLHSGLPAVRSNRRCDGVMFGAVPPPSGLDNLLEAGETWFPREEPPSLGSFRHEDGRVAWPPLAHLYRYPAT